MNANIVFLSLSVLLFFITSSGRAIFRAGGVVLVRDQLLPVHLVHSVLVH